MQILKIQKIKVFIKECIIKTNDIKMFRANLKSKQGTSIIMSLILDRLSKISKLIKLKILS